MRVCVLLSGTIVAVLCCFFVSVYGFWLLSSDLCYCIILPQLICAMYVPFANTYGSIAGYTIGIVLRVLSGDPLLHLPAVIHYPWYDYESQLQKFPHKTLAFVVSLVSIILVSLLMRCILSRHYSGDKLDQKLCMRRSSSDIMYLDDDDLGMKVITKKFKMKA